MSQVLRTEPDARPIDDPAARLSHPDALYEVLGGRVVEKPEMGGRATWIANRLAFLMGGFALEHQLGTVVAEMLFILDSDRDIRRRPDVAFVPASRHPIDRPPPEERDWLMRPDLAVEVVSPNDTDAGVQRKVHEYFRLGIPEVWLVRPPERGIAVYRSPKRIDVFGPEDVLDSGAALPGFRLEVGRLFGEEGGGD